MARNPRSYPVLDRDLTRISAAELARIYAFRPVLRLGAALGFIAAVVMVALGLFGGDPGMAKIGAGVAIGCYLALAIGANDVANSLAPAVGAGAIGLGAGIAMLALAELAGALLAGDAVAYRLADGIIPTDQMHHGDAPARVMVAALLAAALWISAATVARLPVSTTHSIVGAIAGAGAVAFGVDALALASLGRIAAVWVLAPVMGGGVAAGLLALLRYRVAEAPDRASAARFWLPLLIGAMASAFALYLAGLILGQPWPVAAAVSALAGAGFWAMARVRLGRAIANDMRDQPAMKRLFALPLIVSAALMGFAQGANDVGNVAGPLLVIMDHAGGRAIAASGLMVMGIGGVAMALGTALFGRRLVYMVSSGITRLNAVRGFCVTLATAVTVLTASWAGMPVSTTHVAVGCVFGIGFFREWYDNRRRKTAAAPLPIEERRRRHLVRRSYVLSILVAWAVTVPAAAGLSAGIYGLISLVLA